MTKKQTRIFKAGEHLFDAGKKARDLYVLIDGEVVVMDGDKQIDTFSTSGKFIGELSFFSTKVRSYTFIAKVETKVEVVTNDTELLSVIGNNNREVLKLIRTLASKLDILEEENKAIDTYRQFRAECMNEALKDGDEKWQKRFSEIDNRIIQRQAGNSSPLVNEALDGVNLGKTLSASMNEVIGVYLEATINPVDASEEEMDYFSYIPFTGEREGKLYLFLGRKMAGYLGEAFVGETPEDREVFNSCLAELANQVLGIMIKKLINFKLQIGLPVIIEEMPVELNNESDKIHHYQFKSGYLQAYVEFDSI